MVPRSIRASTSQEQTSRDKCPTLPHSWGALEHRDSYSFCFFVSPVSDRAQQQLAPPFVSPALRLHAVMLLETAVAAQHRGEVVVEEDC